VEERAAAETDHFTHGSSVKPFSRTQQQSTLRGTSTLDADVMQRGDIFFTVSFFYHGYGMSFYFLTRSQGRAAEWGRLWW